MNIVRENIEFKRGLDPKEALGLGVFREVESIYFYLLNSSGNEIKHSAYTREYLMQKYNLGFIESVRKKYEELSNRTVEYMSVIGFKATSKSEKPSIVHMEFLDKNDNPVNYEIREALEKLIL